MTREEMITRARQMRERDIFGAVPQEELDAVPAIQTELQIPFGEESVHVFRLVPKDGLPRNCPMILNFHGGGFIKGRQTKDQLFCSQLASEFGCLIWDVDYRLAPEYPFPRAVEESCAVAEYAFRHAEDLGVDPTRIALMGHSAGGNLAITACMKLGEAGNFQPACLIAEFFPADLATDPAEKPRAPGDMPAEVARSYNAFYVSPETAVTPWASPLFTGDEQLEAFPDTLIMSAGKDSLCREDEEFALKLARAGVPVLCRRFRNSPHGFTINRNGEWKESQAMLKAFLRQHLS